VHYHGNVPSERVPALLRAIWRNHTDGGACAACAAAHVAADDGVVSSIRRHVTPLLFPHVDAEIRATLLADWISEMVVGAIAAAALCAYVGFACLICARRRAYR
jgi:hypothetical protein